MKILAGIDFTETSDVVVDKAVEYALAFKAKLWLVHVADIGSNITGADIGPRVIRDYRATVLRKEHKKLHRYADNCVRKGVQCIPLMVQGAALETILEVLNKLNVSLLVLGSHQKDSIYDFVVGSVKNELFHKAKIPILLVPKNLKQLKKIKK